MDELSLRQQLISFCEQLEQLEQALLVDPGNKELLKAQSDLVEVFNLTAQLISQFEQNTAGEEATSQPHTEKAAPDMFADEDEAWERENERRLAEKERQEQRQLEEQNQLKIVEARKQNGDAADETCLAISPFDGRWYEAILHSRKPSEEGKYLVTFTTSGAVEEINSANILLKGVTLAHLNYGAEAELKKKKRKKDLGRTSDDSDSNDDGFMLMEEGYGMGFYEGETRYIVGEWEAHTNGVASKLMARMGYVKGRGLGKEKEGIVKPLGIGYRAPARHKELLGLGHEDRKEEPEDGGKERKRKPRRRGRKRKSTQAETDSAENEGGGHHPQDSTVFDLLNSSVLSRREDNNNNKQVVVEKMKDDVYKKMKAQELQDSLRQRTVESDRLSRKLEALQASYERNRGDPAVARKIKHQMAQLSAQIRELNSDSRELAVRLKIKEGAKKMGVF